MTQTGAPEPATGRVLLLIPTSSYRTEAYVDAAGRLGAPLTVASEHDSAFSHPDDPGLLTLDFGDANAVVSTVRAFHERHPIAAVVGVDDDTVAVAAEIGAALGLRHNPPVAARAAGDKYRQRMLLHDAGVPVPGFCLVDADTPPERVAATTRYPAVLKPLRLSASRGVMRVNDAEELVVARERLLRLLAEPDVRAIGDADAFLVEDFVPGREYAVEGLMVDGQLHVLTVFDKPDPLDGPFFEETIYLTPTGAPAEVERRLVECVDRAVHAIGLREGPVHVEVRDDGEETWLIELAARSIGGRCAAALRFGAEGDVSLEEVVLAAARDGTRPPERAPGASGVMMIPIPQEGWLRSVDGTAEALAVPGVERVDITVHPGQYVRRLPEAARYLGFLFARGRESAAVEGALRTAHDRVNIVMGAD
jgi:biotin carboxylase